MRQSDNPGAKILVTGADRIVLVRMEGKGSFENSTALRDFSKEMIHRGAREFILDLCNCPVMDSTFMGTLTAISLWLRELGEGGLSVVNLNERNAESLLSLGLYQLLNVRVSAIREDGQALPIPLKEEDCTAWALGADRRKRFVREQHGAPYDVYAVLRAGCSSICRERGT